MARTDLPAARDQRSDAAAGPATTTLVLDLTDARLSPRSARSFVTATCTQAGVAEDTLDVVTLLTSEVVTNAVVHAGTAATVHVTAGPTAVRVEVCDGSPVRPRVEAVPDPCAERGRGLLLVDSLADDWGVDDQPPGKLVWFEVRLPAGAAGPGVPSTP